MDQLKECHVPCRESEGTLYEKCVAEGLTMNILPCYTGTSKYDEERLRSRPTEISNEYEVEVIVDHEFEDGEDWYYVKWKDWEETFNTWEPESNLKNACDLVVQYRKEHNLKESNRSKELFERYQRVETKEFAKKILNNGDLATLLKFCGITLLEFQKSHKTVKQLQKELKSVVASVLKNEKLTSKQFRYSTTVSTLLQDTNGPRSELLDFFEKRQSVLKRLHEWISNINSLPGVLVPIEIENNVDMEGPPEDFTYITDYKAGEGIIIPDDPLIGCSCTDCFRERDSCCVAQANVEYAYNQFGYLRVNAGTPIYECNKCCLCPPTCSNRVVQKGRRVKLAIFRTHNGRGWGVKALERIKKGQFVMEYVGEVITTEEAENRGKLYDAEGRTYLFDLDFNDGDSDPYTVDAAKLGNVAHFMNHSCEPNLIVFSIWINNLDPSLPRIAFFARHDISREEELTFDYHMKAGGALELTPRRVSHSPYRKCTSTSSSRKQQDSPPTTPKRRESVDELMETDNDGDDASVRTFDEDDNTKRIPCKCGAKSCRKFLY